MKYRIIILSLLSLSIVLFSLNIGMFWDNVLFGSKMANPLFENGVFNWCAIPLEADAGHPPFLATILAIGWTWFGKSLATSHWMMFPFVFGLLWQLYHLVDFLIADKTLKIGAFILVLSDPSLLSQLVLVTPEVIQLFFFFLALNSLLRHQIYLKTIGLFFLGIVTYRGMMLCAGIFLVDILLHTFIQKKSIKSFFTKSILLTYFIGSLPACSYLLWRIVFKGWIVSHPSQSWGNAMEFSSVQDFLMNFGRNILILGQQFTDFGRIILILFILITLFIKRKKIEWKQYNIVIIIAVFSTFVIYFTSLLIRNTMGHKYYIASYLTIALLAFMLIKEYKRVKFLFLVLWSSLILGNFIVYSDAFPQGWDSSLAHLSYWNLREKGIQYMDEHKLPISETASFFPNATLIDNVDLNGDMRSFMNFSGKEKYVFCSNVYNLSDDDLKTLKENYQVIQTFENLKVRVEILKKN